MDKDLLKGPIKKLTRRWQDITKTEFKQKFYGGVEWINLDWDIIQWQAVVNHPSASSAKVKNEWSINSPPPIHLPGLNREDIL